MSGEVGEGRAHMGTSPHPPQRPNKIKTRQRKGVGRQEGGGTSGGGGRGARWGWTENPGAGWGPSNPIQSKPSQNFKPYLRCLTSGEPDLGKGRRERKKGDNKRRKKKEKGKETKKTRVIKISQREGRKKLLLPQFKNPF